MGANSFPGATCPAGTITYTTPATSAIGGDDESRVLSYPVVVTDLVAGNNVLAVEVHRQQPTARISALTSPCPRRPAPRSRGSSSRQDTRLRARVKSGTTWSALIEAASLAGHRPFLARTMWTC